MSLCELTTGNILQHKPSRGYVASLPLYIAHIATQNTASYCDKLSVEAQRGREELNYGLGIVHQSRGAIEE